MIRWFPSGHCGSPDGRVFPVLAIVAPGQGSQSPGFLAPWLELPGVDERAAAIGEAAGFDLVRHGTTSDEETIKDTALAQPLIVGAGLLTLPMVLGDLPSSAVDVVAGHSVGEVTAAAMAAVLSEREAIVFVGKRGAGMAAASAVAPTGMSAVLGGDQDEVVDALTSLGLTPANMNGAGQIVAAGTIAQLAQLAANPPARARVIPLKVAGAFHTTHMQPAIPELAAYAATLDPADPSVRVLSNADGAVVTSGAEILGRLVRQVANPVRWDLCMAAMADLGVTAMIELAPAGTLVGLAKRALKGVATLAVKSPEDLDAAHQLIRDHSSTITEGD